MTGERLERRNTAARNIDRCNQAIRQLEAEKARWLGQYVDTAQWRGSADDLHPDTFHPEAIGPVMVDEDAVSELAIIEQTSTGAAWYLVRDIGQLTGKMPSTWQQVTGGNVPLWVARKVADQVACSRLDDAKTAQVDQAIQRALGKLSGPALQKAVRKAVIAADPEAFRQRQPDRPARFARVFPTDDPLAGHVSARIDTADAIFFDATLQTIADQLKTRGYSDDDDTLRAKAFGWLANPAKLVSEFGVHTWRGVDDPPQTPQQVEAFRAAAARLAPAFKPPKTQVYVHCHLEAGSHEDAIADVEGVGPLLPDQIRHLVGHAPVTLTPVVHVAAPDLAVDAYEIPDRIREHVLLRDRREAFPYSSKPARGLDLDHTDPYRPGLPGQTRASNLGPLTRRNHRVKTHAPGWKLEQPQPGHYRWTTPSGIIAEVTPQGTTRTTIEQLRLWSRAQEPAAA